MADTKYEDVISFRPYRGQREKLDQLSEATHRTTADILRLLIDRAEIGEPDIRLRSPEPVKVAANDN